MMRRYARILRYARPHWRPLAVVLATMVVSVGFDLLRPWPMKILIDNVLGGKGVPQWLASAVAPLPGSSLQVELLWLAAGGTVVIFLGLTLVSMVNTYASTALGQRMTFDLAGDLFLHLQRLSLIFHSRRPVGDMLARVTGDSYCAQTLVNGAVIPVLQSVTALIGMFVVMWTLQPTLTLLSLGVVPFLLVTIRVFGGPMKDRSRTRRDLEGRMVSIVHQTLTAMPAVQAFTRESLEHGRFRGYADRTVVAYLRASVAAMWFKLFAGLVTAVGTAAIIYAGGRLALDGQLTAGTIIVFLSYLTAMYAPLTAIAYTAETVQTAAAEADRIMEVFDIEPDVVDAPGAQDVRLRGAVRYDGVTFGYEAGRPAIEQVSFTASPGQVVAIVGPTGAGKTTIVNLLPRFFDPWEGTVTIDGNDVRGVRLDSLRRQVALVLQEPFIFPLSVAENIAYGRPEATDADIEAAARAANAHDFVMGLPEGYDTVVGERGGTLSGGERQRLSIARAFLKDAPILILDEPTSALDARTEAMLLTALERLMRGRVTLIIAHRLSTIRSADEILVVDRGRIVERGNHGALLRRDGLYASLYAHQMDVTRHEATNGNGRQRVGGLASRLRRR